MTNFKLKIIIVGPSKVGKSAILQSFLTRSFLTKWSSMPIEIKTKDIEYEKGKVATLSLWDICGRKSFELLRSTLYKGAAGALLVFDLSNKQTLKELKNWLSEIRLFAGEYLPFILIGNKSDLLNNDNDIRNTAKEFAKKEGTIFIETSAKNHLNINKSFVELTKTIIDKAVINIIDKKIKEANQLFKSKQYKKAISDYIDIIGLKSSIFDDWEKLAFSYQQIKEYNNAIDYYIKSQELKPNDFGIMKNLAFCYFQEGIYYKAIEKYQNALDIKSNDLEILNCIGNTYRKTKEFDKAIDYFNKVIDLGGSNSDAEKNLALTNKEKIKFENEIKEKKKAKVSLELNRRLNTIKEISIINDIYNGMKELNDIIKISKQYHLLDIKRKAKMILNKFKNLEDYIREIKTLPYIFEEIEFDKLRKRTGIKLKSKDLQSLVELMIRENQIKAKISKNSLIFEKKEEDVRIHSNHKFDIKKVSILRGGDWKIKGNRSVFYFKVEVENKNDFIINNLQILLYPIPSALNCESDRMVLGLLNPKATVSPTFELIAKKSCIGDKLKGIITFTDPQGEIKTIPIEPFEIKYTCNLLVPKMITHQSYKNKIQRMKKQEIYIDCEMSVEDTKNELIPIFKDSNFFVIDIDYDDAQDKLVEIEGFAEGKYDKEEVALSIIIKSLADQTSKLIVKAMSSKEEKLIDLLNEINNKCNENLKIKLSLDRIEIAQKLSMFIDNPEELTHYLKRVLKSNWTSEEKDKWAEIIRGIFEDWKEVKPGIWNKLGKAIIKITSKFIGDETAKLMSNGMKKLFEWIKKSI